MFWFGLWESEEDYYLGHCFPSKFVVLISHQVEEWNELQITHLTLRKVTEQCM